MAKNLQKITVAVLVLLVSGCFAPENGGTSRSSTTAGPTTTAPSTTTTISEPPASTAAAGPAVRFTEPAEGAVVRPHSDITVAGTVSSFGDRDLWIVSRASGADQLYYLTIQAPVATADGDWSLIDEGVGDESDIGKKRSYLAIAADRDCADALAAVKPDANGVLKLQRLPNSCEQIGPPRVVTF